MRNTVQHLETKWDQNFGKLFTTTENITSNSDDDTTTKRATQRYNETENISDKNSLVWCLLRSYTTTFKYKGTSTQQIISTPVAE